MKALAEEVARISEDHGWTVPPFKDAFGVLAKLMLVTTEVAEAAEAVRKDDFDNYAEELADIVIRVLHLAHEHGVDLEQEILTKMEKNRTRPFLHGNKRA